MKKINIAEPHFTIKDKIKIKHELTNILDGSLSMGPNVKLFEKQFSKKINTKYAIAMNSCTSALEAALQFFNVKNKEVLVPSQSFIATAMAVTLSGGTPIFCEIKKETLNIDINDIKKKVSKKTKGLIIVHMAGTISSDIMQILDFCKKNKLFLIEDAAHTPGAIINGKQAGSIGDVGCFSFYPTKIITSGEGGMLTTSKKNIANFARSYQNRGRDIFNKNEVYVNPGRNVRMTEISALLGRIQLSKLDKNLKRRRDIAKIYINSFKRLKDVFLVTPKKLNQSSFWKFPIILGSKYDRDKIIKKLMKKGVQADAAYKPPLHLQPVIKKIYNIKKGHLPFSENILKRHLCLPCHQNMTTEDAKYVVNNFLEILKKK